jgi:alpha-N-arabinofuranosidase
MKKLPLLTLAWIALLANRSSLSAAEYHVAVNGNDAASGRLGAPFRTIQRAASQAEPGDTVTVHAGVYRERVNPPRGGESDARRIVYQAAPGEKVEITGSERMKCWVHVEQGVWKATLPNWSFGAFNPYAEVIRGDWFDPKGRLHHTGAVYLDGEWLTEAATLEELFKPAGENSLWHAQVDGENTMIWAQFKGVDPNEQIVEINVRRTVFYPDQPGRNYITVRGFTLRDAATPWAPPTAEQVGLIGTHWSKGWIIESNMVTHSICAGIALGKYGDQWDNTSANTAEGYVKTIERALANGWNKETIGHHVVRDNTISHCEQAGIVGSLGAAFSTVTDNEIHDIHVRRLFSGAEMAGIKFHAAIDTVIRNNHIHRTCLGLWLDWMAQGTRVSANLFHDNSTDLFLEVDHGPFVIDNNLFLSRTSFLDMSEGGTFAHNLFRGTITSRPEPSRATPYHLAHSTTVAGLINIKGADDRFYNNVFVGDGSSGGSKTDAQHAPGWGLWVYDKRELPLVVEGNLYYAGARPYANELNPQILGESRVKLDLTQEPNRILLSSGFGAQLSQNPTRLVDSALLGRAKIPGLPYENADGSPVRIDTDYFGHPRSGSNPTPGPFEHPLNDRIVVWPR